MKLPITLFLVQLFMSLAAISQAYVFDFSAGDHGFVGGVSDFGVNQSGFEAATSLYFTSITVDFDISNANVDAGRNTDIKIYPNPCNGEFTIESESNKPFNYKILDLTGKEIKEKEKRLPTGIYLIKVKSEGKEFVRKLIVN